MYDAIIPLFIHSPPFFTYQFILIKNFNEKILNVDPIADVPHFLLPPSPLPWPSPHYWPCPWGKHLCSLANPFLMVIARHGAIFLERCKGVEDPEKLLYSVWEEEVEWEGGTEQVLYRVTNNGLWKHRRD